MRSAGERRPEPDGSQGVGEREIRFHAESRYGNMVQVLNWSGLPVVHVRPTVFLQNPFFLDWAAKSIAGGSTIRLPFGAGRTSPIDARDVAEVIAAILATPAAHIGKVYELTGPRSEDMRGVASEYSEALGRPITYVDGRSISGVRTCSNTICRNISWNIS
jgi:uncharacterized protein YbjT (DUF2867 family)